jgi:hypothetical protein
MTINGEGEESLKCSCFSDLVSGMEGKIGEEMSKMTSSILDLNKFKISVGRKEF